MHSERRVFVVCLPICIHVADMETLDDEKKPRLILAAAAVVSISAKDSRCWLASKMELVALCL